MVIDSLEDIPTWCSKGHKLEKKDRFVNGTCRFCQSVDRRLKTVQRQLIKLEKQQLECGRLLQGASEDLRELVLKKRNVLDLQIEAKRIELFELQHEAEWTSEEIQGIPPLWTWSKLTKKLEEIE
jgi:hypothetical protein